MSDAEMDSQERVFDFIRAKAKNEPKIKRVILFGSRARNHSDERSDYDLAIDEVGMTDSEWSGWALDFREQIPTLCGLDLIRLGPDLSKELALEIQKDGVEIYVSG